jgi:two-component system, chemotaxis family, sensor kinase Cph1
MQPASFAQASPGQPSPGRHSARARSCDAEPIHIPGSIQPHGVFLLFDSASERLAHWAGDMDRLTGAEPTAGMRSDELLGAPLQDLIGSRLLIAGEEAVHAGAIEPPGKEPLTVVVSRTGSFIAVELEPAGIGGNAIAALEQVRAVSDRIGSMPSLADACQAAATHVRSIIGYDRVMVYRFLDDGSGSVVAEARAPDAAAYMNHRFPESDIPAQARDLYRRNLIRVIPDSSYTPAPLRPEVPALSIDMSHCVLRSVSPVHIQYLKNMEVGASISVSLLVDGKLWGLIACHHRSARSVSAESRLLCRHVGTSLSAFILSFGYAEDSRQRAARSAALEETLKSLRATSDPERMLRSSAGQLARLVDCGGFALLADGELVASAGKLPEGRNCASSRRWSRPVERAANASRPTASRKPVPALRRSRLRQAGSSPSGSRPRGRCWRFG